MGLPIWRAPSPADQRAQAVKNDASAATRSPIRRSSPASSRPGRISARSDTSDYTRRYINVAELFTHRENEREADRRTRERRNADLSSMADDWLFHIDRLATITSEPGEQTSGPEERVHLYISNDSTGASSTYNPFSRSDSTTAERESNSDVDRPRPRDGSERPRPAPRGMELISRASNRRRRGWSSRRQEPLGELPRHTYRRAPNNWPFSNDVVDGDEVEGGVSAPTDAGRDLADATREFPPLRRMGRRQVTDGLLPASSLRQSWGPSGVIDGLGDRDRSLSPHPAEAWETMLTTITPDEQLPSTDSSFTSAAASASFSTSNNSQDGSESNRAGTTSSPNTQLTVPSRRHSQDESASLLPQRGCETDDDISGNDTESEERLDTHGTVARSRRHSPHGSGSRSRLDGPPSRNPGAYPSSVRSRSRDATAFVRNYFAFAERAPSSSARSTPSDSSRSPPPQSSQFHIGVLPRLEREHSSGDGDVERSSDVRRDSGVGSDANGSSSDGRIGDSAIVSDLFNRAAEGPGPLDPELESMRNILEMLARRDDVPDAFWLSAGLVPPVPEGMTRREQRERERL